MKQLMDAQMYAVFTIRKRVHQERLHRTANMQPAEASLMEKIKAALPKSLSKVFGDGK